MKKKIIRDPKTGRTRVISVNPEGEKNQTQQHHKDAHDVNAIMRKYQKVGIGYNQLPPNTQGLYGDFSKSKTYQESVQAAIDVQDSFATLPSTIRKRFENDPQQLINFLNDKNNRAEAIALGLVPTPPPSTEPKTSEAQPTKT